MIKLSYITPTGGDGTRTRYEIPTTSSITEKQVSTTIISNFGQSGTITWTLPTAEKELDFIAQIGTATGTDYIIIKPPPGSVMLLLTDFVTQIDCKDAKEGDSIWFRVIESVVDGTFLWFGTIIEGVWLSLNDLFWCVGGVQDSAQVNANREMDVKKNTWSLNTPFPVTHQSGSSAMIDGKMYVGAGKSTSGFKYPYLSAFNFITKSWSSTISISRPYGFVSFIGIGPLGYYYSASVASPSAGLQVFDSELISWTTKFPGETHVKNACFSFSSKNTEQTEQGIFYGCGATMPVYAMTATNYFYYPPLNYFISKTVFPVGVRQSGGSFRKNETEGHCLGGLDIGSSGTASNQKFSNISSGIWTGEASLPFFFWNQSGNIGCGVGGKGYITGGPRNGYGSPACSQYDDNIWTLMTPYPATYISEQSTTSTGENAVA